MLDYGLKVASGGRILRRCLASTQPRLKTSPTSNPLSDMLVPNALRGTG